VVYTGDQSPDELYAALYVGGVTLDLSGSAVTDFAYVSVAGKKWVVNLILPDSLTEILDALNTSSVTTGTNSSAFNGFPNLKTVRAAGVGRIGSYAFTGRSALESIDFPAAGEIATCAFDGCTLLAGISLPAVETIGSYAFNGCTALAEVSLPLERLKIFLICGGMPEAVSHYVRTGDLLGGELVLNDLLITLKADFAKYRKRIPLLLLNEVFESVMHQTEGKFVYERAASGTPAAQVKQALELLVMAGLVHPVTNTAGNGIPLGAEANRKFRRIIPCDTGLFLYILGLRREVLPAAGFKAVNRGALAEIFTGLELLKNASCYTPQELYCWQRSTGRAADSAGNGSSACHGNAQVDFLIQKGSNVVPIEVKSGTQGTMQSLRLFMKEKQGPKGARTSLENFGRNSDIDIYPLYAIGNLVQVPVP
jgi:hypothetical protein